jgi:hypothetical protein
VREGHEDLDKSFPKASTIPPREMLRGGKGIDALVDELKRDLIQEEARGVFEGIELGLITPGMNDRAIDHPKGLCIYYKMPKCGFQLPLSEFIVDLLTSLDVAPSQIASTAWCYISSFDKLFAQYSEYFEGYTPTVALFGKFYYFSVTSDDYLSVKARSFGEENAKKRVFTPSSKLNKIEFWNEGWVYIPHHEQVPSLEKIRKHWRPLKVNGKKQKSSLPDNLTREDCVARARLEKLIKR